MDAPVSAFVSHFRLETETIKKLSTLKKYLANYEGKKITVRCCFSSERTVTLRGLPGHNAVGRARITHEGDRGPPPLGRLPSPSWGRSPEARPCGMFSLDGRDG